MIVKNILLFAQEKAANCPLGSDNPNCVVTLPKVRAGQDEITTVLQVVFAVAAGVALIALMIAALNYVTAFSDQDKIVRSRRNIIYSVIGLLIALSAEAIILTVVGKL